MITGIRMGLVAYILLGSVALSIGNSPPQPSDLDVTQDITYRTIDEVDLKLDIYAPNTGGPYPAVLIIHGGGWNSGSKATSATTGMNLALNGFVTFVLDYRLAPPGGTFHAPAPIEDVRAAIAWVEANGGAFGAEAERIGLVGASTGGYLALMAGMNNAEADVAVDAIVSWSGPTDLPAAVGSPLEQAIANYLGCGYQVCPDTWRNSSPLSYVSADDPAVYLANSRAELVPLDQATTLATLLRQVNAPVALRVIEGTQHVEYVSRHVGPVWDESIAFLIRNLASAADSSNSCAYPGGSSIPPLEALNTTSWEVSRS